VHYIIHYSTSMTQSKVCQTEKIKWMHMFEICTFLRREREKKETKRRTEREKEREKQRKREFKIIIFQHLLIVFPYSHNEKDIHWHPQQRSILDKYHIHYTVHAMHNEKPPSEDFVTRFSSGYVVNSLELFLWHFFLFHCMEVLS